MSDLPPGWARAVIGEVTSEVRSGFASGRHNATGEGIAHLRPMNVSRLGEIDLSEVKYVDPSCDDRRLEPGDILFNNTNSPALVGKTALVRQISGENAFSNHMTRLRTVSGVVPAFLASQLHFLWMTGRLSHVITNHVNQASISAKVLASQVEVVMPPRAEQERIVAAIEEYLSHLTAAESALRSADQRTLAVQQAFLRSALVGKWRWVRLADVAEVRLGRQRSPAKATGERMRPYLRAANVTWDGLELTDVKTMAFTESESATYELRPGDLLLSEASGSPGEVGKPAQYRGEINGVCFQNTLIRVRLPNEMLPDFYELFFRHEARSGKFASGSRGVGIHHLGATALADWQVPLLPKSEQQRVVEEADRHSTALRHVRRSVEDAKRRATRLRNSILAAAFSGELVPQDSNDEPASALLDRIRAERAVNAPRRRPAKAAPR